MILTFLKLHSMPHQRHYTSSLPFAMVLSKKRNTGSSEKLFIFYNLFISRYSIVQESAVHSISLHLFHSDKCTIIVNSNPLFGNIVSGDRAPIQSLLMRNLLSDSKLLYSFTMYELIIYNCYQNLLKLHHLSKVMEIQNHPLQVIVLHLTLCIS